MAKIIDYKGAILKFLLFDDACALCREFAMQVAKYSRGVLDPLPLRSNEARRLLEAAYGPAWPDSFFVIDHNEERTRAFSGRSALAQTARTVGAFNAAKLGVMYVRRRAKQLFRPATCCGQSLARNGLSRRNFVLRVVRGIVVGAFVLALGGVPVVSSNASFRNMTLHAGQVLEGPGLQTAVQHALQSSDARNVLSSGTFEPTPLDSLGMMHSVSIDGEPGQLLAVGFTMSEARGIYYELSVGPRKETVFAAFDLHEPRTLRGLSANGTSIGSNQAEFALSKRILLLAVNVITAPASCFECIDNCDRACCIQCGGIPGGTICSCSPVCDNCLNNCAWNCCHIQCPGCPC